MAATTTTFSNPCDDAAIPTSIITTSDRRTDDMLEEDPLSRRLRTEALAALRDEPELTLLLHNTVLAPGVRTLEDAVATTITYRLLLRPCHTTLPSTTTLPPPQQPEHGSSSSSPGMMFCPYSLRGILAQALQSTTTTEAGHTMAQAVRRDVLAVIERDPAVDTVLEVVLFLEGFAALVCHRAAYFKWHSSRPHKKSMTALWLQSQASAVFGLDIHPAATMGAGILLDHGTGIVIGETATVGDGCTLLHGVTLGGTGKDSGDRHPKVGQHVLIGANASLLGNITVGNGAKIGAGSIVLGPIPSGATAVGAPAKIIGRATEADPANMMDETLQQVSPLHKSASSATMTTTTSTVTNSTTSTTTTNNIQRDSITEEDETGWNDTEEETTTEEGNHSTHSNKDQDHNNQHTPCCCPFREFVHLARSAPPGSITICTLRRLLHPEGCSVSVVGEVLFALDTRNVGYVQPHVFFTPDTQKVLVDKTQLAPDRVAAMMAAFQEQWTQEQALLHHNTTTTTTTEHSGTSLLHTESGTHA